MLKKYSYIWSAAMINLVFFIAFFSLLYPIYNSKEDAYAAYLVSGGFGHPPTAFLHYNYMISPFLNVITKTLSQLTDRVNWYSISLIAGHYVSCTVILALLLKRKKNLPAFLSYLILFLVFEGFFLIILDFTGTSIALGCSALLYLLNSARTKLSLRQSIVVVLLLLLASLYRIHSLVPLIGVSMLFLFFLVPRKEKLRAFTTLIAAGLFILLFNFFHRAYYTAKDPGWPRETANLETVFSFYNYNPAFLYDKKPGEKWYVECELLRRGLILDSSFFSGRRLDSMYHDSKSMKSVHHWPEREWFKWFFINNRLFFCVTAFFILLFGLQKRTRLPLLASLVCVAAGCAYLTLTAKLPPYILASALYLICLILLISSDPNPAILNSKSRKYIALTTMCFFILWGIVRLYKTNLQNKELNTAFKAAYAELALHKDKLFIITRNFPIHLFYIFDRPTDYKLENYTDTEHFIINIYRPVFEKFNIKSNTDIPFSSNVLFWGEPTEGLRLYFEKITGKPMKISAPLPEFKQATVWRIQPAAESN